MHGLRAFRLPHLSTTPHGVLALALLLAASIALVTYHQSVIVTALLGVGLVPQAVIGVFLVHALRITWGSVPRDELARTERILAWCGTGVMWVLVGGWWLAIPAGVVVAAMHRTPDWWWVIPFALHVVCSLVRIERED